MVLKTQKKNFLRNIKINTDWNTLNTQEYELPPDIIEKLKSIYIKDYIDNGVEYAKKNFLLRVDKIIKSAEEKRNKRNKPNVFTNYNSNNNFDRSNIEKLLYNTSTATADNTQLKTYNLASKEAERKTKEAMKTAKQQAKQAETPAGRAAAENKEKYLRNITFR